MRTSDLSVRKYLAISITILLSTCVMAQRSGNPSIAVDSSAYGYDYAYAPSMVYDQGIYRVWYGSEDNIYGWDSVRYSTSSDGITWSAPTEVILCSNYNLEHSCCDPSVVYYQGYWYCFYSANLFTSDIQTVHCVARASQPGGPYYKYTQRGTWESNPSDPQVIIYPIDTDGKGLGWYGSGGASVVARNNKLYMWWKDDTTTENPTSKIFFATTTNPVSWPTPTQTNLVMSSTDVHWDEKAQYFVQYVAADPHSANSSMQRYFSRDGIDWSGPFNMTDLPNYSHNVGILRDKYGHTVLNGKNIITYGAPYDFIDDLSWPYWDLCGNTWNDPVYVKGDFDGDGKLDPAMVDTMNGRWYIRSSLTGLQGTSDIPWGWYWYEMTPRHALACGDYDGDGVIDRAIVDFEASGGAKWYVISSSTGAKGVPGIPWGWQWVDSGPHHTLALGDYDGDGKTDRAIVDFNAPGGASWYVMGSSSGLGTPEIPWGWQWTDSGPHHTLLLGDFDGDGKADRAVVDRHVDGGMTWYVMGSTSGLGTPDIPWGWQWEGVDATYALAIEDYDGDGKMDRAVVGPGNHSPWYVYSSITHDRIGDFSWGDKWGGMNDHHQVVSGDYDGDGKADRAIVDPDLGPGAKWYIRGNSGVPWGWTMQISYEFRTGCQMWTCYN